MLRPEWRLWPVSSFLGAFDLKTGVTIVLLFALLNKVAGVYGLIALLTGAGGSFAQLSLYIYSVLGLVAFVWGLKVVKEEEAKHSLYVAHLFFADHVFSTSWTIFFAVVWWLYTPHDGRRQANSPAQDQIRKGGIGLNHTLTDAEREVAANIIWNQEKGTAAAVIAISWLAKIYFAILLYSYAAHLRKGSYRSLPHSRPNTAMPSNTYETALTEEDEDIEQFYRTPTRREGAGSVSSMTDFLSAPGRGRRGSTKSSLGKNIASYSSSSQGEGSREVLFDEDDGRMSSKDGDGGSESSSSRVRR
ncbi:hypothetical protein SERLA73DRAFT_99550 [Serpula lacrymans var. lacrymans S7.3]|uniref:DUF1753-domain-containing protein n=2 Tax=Serpula lacrymans var. lacrymans TaxID=341189 RepID=F8QHG9_SERL3|nr:uncharacterized protein SERLADRAFT_362596 [Serpula lacrymans var. lacrymans S7.9]EGN92279.1 hypothetical protein SERLA73DRAFT_99550 [Serpula lacrymans var. lacrymans S7.3]EGO22234.1 hypothetical protein SERLADRAFT_362596 [Serpula lacrymans var. lacrymans S7.9]